jgi:hypothetical protein
MNYLYSLLIRSYANSDGSTRSIDKQLFTLVAIGLGGFINLIMYFILQFEAHTLAFGLAIGILLGLLAAYYPGYTYLERVKTMPPTKARWILSCIVISSALIFLYPILVEFYRS